MTQQFTRIGVILAAREVPPLVDFYRDVLGFEVEAVFEGPAYAILSRNGIRLSIAEQGHPADDLPDYTMTVVADRARPAGMLVIETEDCDALLAEVRERGARVASEVYRPAWGGARAFVADPEGNLIELEQLA